MMNLNKKFNIEIDYDVNLMKSIIEWKSVSSELSNEEDKKLEKKSKTYIDEESLHNIIENEIIVNRNKNLSLFANINK
jgi:hypothetical protein